MDPWGDCQNNVVTISEISLALKFEDNFSPLYDKLPDSAQYLAVLEEKLQRLKNNPDILGELAKKREDCMQQLLAGDLLLDEQIELETPINNSALFRAVLPQKQALNQGEVVELVKYDQLGAESEADSSAATETEENKSPR